MRNTIVLFKRELAGYFATPVAYVFICIFLLLCGILTFYMGGFFEGGQATLGPAFFEFHPILYIVLIPAISMRLWAEERKQGTIELLMTLPVTLPQLVLSKFLAAWVFAGIALGLTFPLWLTVNYLGDPDNGVILASYVASWLMAGGYLAMGACISAVTKNQVIAFVLAVIVCLLFLIPGLPQVQEVLAGVLPGETLVDAVKSFSFMTHFGSIARGVIDLRDLVFFASVIGVFLFLNAIVIELKKAD
ncbi:MAG: ABC transporter permease [Planctomycetota bacterium]|nr:ABC transporter permease [Planctomycetota bacterium]